MSKTFSITVEDTGPASRLVIPIQPGATILRGFCGTGKTKTLDAIAVALGSKTAPKLTPRHGTKRGTVDCCGVILSVSDRVTRTGESEVASSEEYDLGTLIDPPVKDTEARNRHGIKSLLRMTKAEAKPDLFYHLVGDKADFEALIAPEATKSADLVEMAGKIKRALEAESRKAEAAAEREEAAAAADRNAGDGLDLKAETDYATLQQALEEAAGTKSQLDEQARAAIKARSDAEQARSELAKIGSSAQSSAEAAENLREAKERQTAAQVDANGVKDDVARLEAELKAAKAEYGSKLVALQAATDAVTAAEKAVQAVERTKSLAAGWQAAIDAAANASSPSDEDLSLAADCVVMARRAIETAALVRAAQERIANAKAHQENAAKARKEAARLRDAAKGTDAVLSAAIASERFAVDSGLLIGTLPGGKAAPYYDLSDGERTMIACAEKIDWVRANEPDPERVGVIDLPQRTLQDLPDSVREQLFTRAAERLCCVVSAQVDEGPLRAEVWEPQRGNGHAREPEPELATAAGRQ